jgi:hypothetical protein
LRPEADRSPPYGAEVKNAWSYTSTSSYFFMAWCLIKHKYFNLPFSKEVSNVALILFSSSLLERHEQNY